MGYYQKHVFFCCNLRTNGKQCCADGNAEAMRHYAKERIEALGLKKSQNPKGGIRINMAGCMDRCSKGPVMVVYPDGIWYTYRTQGDIDEIIESHLINNVPVTRLIIDSD